MTLSELYNLPNVEVIELMTGIDEISTPEKPCMLIDMCITIASSTCGWDIFLLLSKYDFDTLEHLVAGVKAIAWKIAHDPFLNFKENQKQNPVFKSLTTIYKTIINSNKLIKYANTVSNTYWNSYVIPQNLAKTIEKIRIWQKNADIFAETSQKIIKVYGFSDFEMRGIRYFISHIISKLQDPALNRSLYFYGKKQYTGKTTVAKIICGILNGYENWRDVATHYEEYKSDIPNELQFDRFIKPKATKYNCVLMDEAFKGTSTKKYYDNFKSALTGNRCDIEEKFGGVYSVPCRRNYIFTSNKSPEHIIEDEHERRIAPVFFKFVPEKMSYPDIFNLWKSYIYNLSPEIEDDMAYYEATYPDAEGRESTEIKDRLSVLQGDEFDRALRTEQGFGHYQVTFPAFFFTFFFNMGFPKNEAGNDFAKRAVIQLFAEPRVSGYRKYYNINDLQEILRNLMYGNGNNSK